MKDALRALNLIARLDATTNEELIDDIICYAINNDINVDDIDSLEEKEIQETQQMIAFM